MTGFTRGLGKIGHCWQKSYTKCTTSTLRFQSASNNLIGLLTVGAVIGTGVTVTDYVIEWRLGSTTGAIQLITGKGSDPAIQAFHPIVSEPVVGGVMYAVIRYIVIDGIRYSPYFRQGQYSPDLKTCLGSVTVVTMNCGNGMGGSYSHVITYSNNLHPANNAERNLRFNLNNDGSSIYFAWYIAASYVADRVTISYVHLNDEANPIVIDDWVVGSNATTNYTTTPKVRGSGYQTLKRVIDLTRQTHQSGDYLLIHVTPRYFEPNNNNTNWQVAFKCLTSFDCYAGPDGKFIIETSSIVMVWNTTNCQWELRWNNRARYNPPYVSLQYIEYTQYSGGVGFQQANTEQYSIYFRQNVQASQVAFNANYTKVLQSGSSRVQKTGAEVKITFTSATDYNRYKDSYNAMVANANWAMYSTDTAVLEHYIHLYFTVTIGNSIGDATSDYYFYGHHDSTFIWDDANMMVTYTMANVTNGISEVTCNQGHIYVDNMISNINYWINQANFDLQTNLAFQSPCWGNRIFSYSLNETTKINQSLGYGTPDYRLVDVCIPSDWTSQSGDARLVRLAYVDGYITNNADPANNFRLSTWLNDDGTQRSTPLIVYEKLNGVQIIP